MSTLWRDIQYKMLKNDSRISLLIGINVVVFILLSIPAIATIARENLLLPGDVANLGRHFWALFTFLFVGEGFLPVLFNLLWLYWMGRIFEEYLNHKRLIGLYILAGITGGVFYVIGYNLLALAHISVPPIITGASVSVLSIIVATATLLPQHEVRLIIIGSVKLKWVAIVYTLLALLGARDNIGAQIAHAGAALFGFVYIKQLQKGNDWIGGIIKLFQPKPKMRVVSYNNAPQKRANNLPQQDEVDRILDKIYVSGMDSLSKQEKETLSRASNNNEG